MAAQIISILPNNGALKPLFFDFPLIESSLFLLSHSPFSDSPQLHRHRTEGRPTRPAMAPTHSRAVLALSLLLSAPTILAQASPSLGVVDPSFGSNEVADGLFDYDYSQFDEEDPLPPPLPADYELLSDDEFAEVFKRSVNGDEMAKRWHGHGLEKRAFNGGRGWNGASTFRRAGTTGVGAMQVTVVDDDNIVICESLMLASISCES